MSEEPIWVRIDVAKGAKTYRALANEYRLKSEAYMEALEGTRVRANRRGVELVQEKTMQVGFWEGQAAAYDDIANGFENLMKRHQPNPEIADLARRASAL